jgi:hypothetical protein
MGRTHKPGPGDSDSHKTSHVYGGKAAQKYRFGASAAVCCHTRFEFYFSCDAAAAHLQKYFSM